MRLGRRDFLRSGQLAVASVVVSNAGRVSTPLAAAASAEQAPATAKTGPIIDFRIRPPFKGFLKLANYSSGKYPSIDEFMQDFDRSGVDVAIVMGRQTPNSTRYRGSWGTPYGSVPNEDVAELVKSRPGRLLGFGGINGETGAEALREVDRCKAFGFKGIALDNGWCDPPLTDDDKRLFPIYEKCEADGLIVAISSSIAIGPDMDYSKPIHIQRVGDRFRKLKIIVPHGSWPWVTLSCATALRNPNIHIIPDYYISMPNSGEYVDWANTRLTRQVLFASSYPGGGTLSQAVDRYRKLPFASDEIRRRVMGQNAAELLGLKL
jgi:hypothetical protein